MSAPESGNEPPGRPAGGRGLAVRDADALVFAADMYGVQLDQLALLTSGERAARAAAARAARSPRVSNASWSSCTPYMSAAKISASASLTASPPLPPDPPVCPDLPACPGAPRRPRDSSPSGTVIAFPVKRLQPHGDDGQLLERPAAEQVKQPSL